MPISIDPPDALSDDVTDLLGDCSDRELRALIHYAQRLLRDHAFRTDAIEARDGERLVRVDDRGSYTIAIVERREGGDGDRGPFAYSVHREPQVDGDEGRYRWHYLGRVADGSGGE